MLESAPEGVRTEKFIANVNAGPDFTTESTTTYAPEVDVDIPDEEFLFEPPERSG